MTDHNHEMIGQELYAHYPEQRRLVQEENKHVIRTMMGMNVQVKLLQDFINSQVNMLLQWAIPAELASIKR